MTLAGLTLAARLSKRPEAELLAQAVDGLLPLYRDANGGFYFAREDLTVLPRRLTCAVKGCGRVRKSAGLCSTHSERLRRGADVGSRVQVEKAQRGSTKRERTGQHLRLAKHSDAPEVRDVARSEHEVLVRRWESEDRLFAEETERLGTPEIWQQVADEALERAWDDLASGRYETDLKARLTDWQTLRQPKTIQSPLVATVKPESQPEMERRSA